MGHIRQAIAKLRQLKGIEIVKASSVYETEPEGYQNQPWFLNTVLELRTSLRPLSLLELLLDIESQMGRKRNRRYGARNIDLDLLLFDDLVIESDKLTLPHPRMHERRFVLVPLVKIAPTAVHPLLKKSVKRLLEELSPDSVSEKGKAEVRLYSERVF